jgi:hypothetical protein
MAAPSRIRARCYGVGAAFTRGFRASFGVLRRTRTRRANAFAFVDFTVALRRRGFAVVFFAGRFVADFFPFIADLLAQTVCGAGGCAGVVVVVAVGAAGDGVVGAGGVGAGTCAGGVGAGAGPGASFALSAAAFAVAAAISSSIAFSAAALAFLSASAISFAAAASAASSAVF